MIVCLHCRDPRLPVKCRGLCRICWSQHRDKYLSKNARPNDAEPTQEELDRMISEQMTCLPKWWHGENIRQKDNHWLSSRVVRMGRDIVNTYRHR